jgi:hypothetical protein
MLPFVGLLGLAPRRSGGALPLAAAVTLIGAAAVLLAALAFTAGREAALAQAAAVAASPVLVSQVVTVAAGAAPVAPMQLADPGPVAPPSDVAPDDAAAAATPRIQVVVDDDGVRFQLERLPALSADGRQLVVGDLDNAGGRGAARLTIHLLDARDGHRLASWRVLDADEPLAGPRLLPMLARRLVEVQTFLASTRWRPLVIHAVNRSSARLVERYPEEPDGFGPYSVEVHGGPRGGEVELRQARQVLGRALLPPGQGDAQATALYSLPGEALTVVKLEAVGEGQVTFAVVKAGLEGMRCSGQL